MSHLSDRLLRARSALFLAGPPLHLWSLGKWGKGKF